MRHRSALFILCLALPLAAAAAVDPIRVEFEGGSGGYFYMFNTQSKQSTTQKLSKRPKNVVLAPDYSLLANIRRD